MTLICTLDHIRIEKKKKGKVSFALCLIWITDKKWEFVAVIYLQGASCAWRKTLCMKIHFEPHSTPGMRFLKDAVSLMICASRVPLDIAFEPQLLM
ncbi:hypothetical protein SO802_007482 [Lithocarpus litseifolius]|uniref:Uncharacterized protein n=1 Tax=Lithocarpus litseifolius TaxID=425828 RepID=A0AAW2DQH5_9ROSI